MQVTAYGRQTVSDRGVVRSCDPLQNFGGSSHITGTAEPQAVKFCTRLGYINDISPTKGAWLWSRDCFKILPFVMMRHIARVVSDSWPTCTTIASKNLGIISKLEHLTKHIFLQVIYKYQEQERPHRFIFFLTCPLLSTTSADVSFFLGCMPTSISVLCASSSFLSVPPPCSKATPIKSISVVWGAL